MEYIFYELFPGVVVERACTSLLEKIYESGSRVVVYSPITERVKSLNDTLWTFKQISFVPHGSSETDYQPGLQPIWITSGIENPNNAQVLMLVDFCDKLQDDLLNKLNFSKTVYIAPATDEYASKNLRDLYADVSASCNSTFWAQNKNGDWQKL